MDDSAEEEQSFNLRSASYVDEDSSFKQLRPQRIDEFVGQEKLRENLSIAVRAAARRGESIDHILFHGPPGLGKTTLAEIVAKERGVSFKATSGPVLERSGDLAAILSSLEEFDVLFIDEIHRMNRVVEEVLYPAMEDFRIDIIIGGGPSARSVKLDLKPFTLVGATTRTGLLSSPLRDRFGILERLDFYEPKELQRIVIRSAEILGIGIEDKAAMEVAKRSRGTPRIANRLLRRVRDYTEDQGMNEITMQSSDAALDRLDIDSDGLDKMDRLILESIIEKFSGGPVGLDTLAAAVNEDKDTLEDVYEPYLLQQGFLKRTSRGRVATEKSFKRYNLPFPTRLSVNGSTDGEPEQAKLLSPC